MAELRIFSGDSHVSEPADLWTTRLDDEFKFRAPRVEARERGGKMVDMFIYEGWPPHPVGVGLGAAARAAEATNREAFREGGRGYNDARPGGWNPVERLKDMEIDGVAGEILHTTLGFRLFWLRDMNLMRACFRVYNDWLAEYCSESPKRLVGVPLICLDDINLAIEELRRTAKLGLRGAMIWLSPPEGYPDYTSMHYDPFWAAAQELDMPMVLHEITGGAESRLSPSSYWDPNIGLAAIIRSHEAQRVLAQFTISGVLERFPGLKIISAENGTDWVPFFLKKLRSARGGTFPTKLSMAPIDYYYRQCYFTYINEQHAVLARDEIGIDNLMFATDYPHSASPWPKSMEVVNRDTEGMEPEVAQKLIHDNVLKVFNIPAPVLV